jgi:hypothetical protein
MGLEWLDVEPGVRDMMAVVENPATPFVAALRLSGWGRNPLGDVGPVGLRLGTWPPAGLALGPSGKPYCSDPQIPGYSSDPSSDFQAMLRAGGCDNSEAPDPQACLQQMVNEKSWGWRPASLDPISFCNAGAARTFGGSAYVIAPGTPLPAPQPMSAVYPQALLSANAAAAAQAQGAMMPGAPPASATPASTGPQNQAAVPPLSSYFTAPPSPVAAAGTAGDFLNQTVAGFPMWGVLAAVGIGLVFFVGGKH